MYTEQVSTDNIVSAFIYFVSAVSVLFVVIGLGLIDSGLARKKNVLHTWVQRFVACLLGGAGMGVCGYAIWQWQFYTAFGVDGALKQALSDWWLGSHAVTTASVMLDPKTVPEADVQQVFVVFFITFAMATIGLIHSGTIERIKSAPLYTMAFIAGLIFCPLAGYLTWGPVSPLTNLGLHDFEGVLPLYVFAGTWSLIVAWRLGARAGVFSPDPLGLKPGASNYASVALGAFFIMVAVPLVAIGSTWIAPGKGVSGISMTQSGIGIILVNVFCALLGGGIAGAVVACLTKEPVWVFFGPVAGAVMCGALFDIGTSLQCVLFGMGGPIVAMLTSRLISLLKIDEPKVVPLGLGPGAVGAILVGFVHWGKATAGFPDLTGEFAPGHAHITPLLQLEGVLAVMALAAVPALLICLVFEKTSGLRISRQCEVDGMDVTYWSKNAEEITAK